MESRLNTHLPQQHAIADRSALYSGSLHHVRVEDQALDEDARTVPQHGILQRSVWAHDSFDTTVRL
eukprot:22386-Eustigmatos_ZCMA.PRE.1